MSLSIHDHDTILDEIRHWPRDAQLALAREILQTATADTPPHATEPSAEEVERPRRGLRNLVGLLATDHPAPSDEDIERWREEWRMEKYGR